jgi:hypothetical protein
VYAVAHHEKPASTVWAGVGHHAVVVLGNKPGRGPPLDRRVEALLEQRLQIALGQADRGGKGTLDAGEVELSDLPARGEERHAGDWERGGEDRFGDTSVVPELEGPGVQVGGVRDRRALRRGVDDSVRDPEPLELARQDQPDRIGTGGENGHVNGRRRLLLLRCRRA